MKIFKLIFKYKSVDEISVVRHNHFKINPYIQAT